MPTVHIRIVELLTKEKHSSINSFYVLTHTSKHPKKISKMKITENKYGKILSCEKTISLFIHSQLENYLYFDLKRYHLIVADDLIGQLVLPLEWFPTNHVVREWFPFAKSENSLGGMILLDIHVDARNAEPFMAPFSVLRVYPCWTRPTLCENAELPTIPPIVYVLSSQATSNNYYSNNINNQENSFVPPTQSYVHIKPVNPYSKQSNINRVPLGYSVNNNIQMNQQQIQPMTQNMQEQVYYQQQLVQLNQTSQNMAFNNDESNASNLYQNNSQRQQQPLQIYSLDINELEKENELYDENENNIYQPQEILCPQYPEIPQINLQ